MMPIKKENLKRYPKNWPEIRARIKARAGNKCEICGAENGQPNPATGARVVCTVMHLDHTPENCADRNLKFGCQLCHNRYDAKHRAETRRTKNET
jgi:hypothetical protein